MPKSMHSGQLFMKRCSHAFDMSHYQNSSKKPMHNSKKKWKSLFYFFGKNNLWKKNKNNTM